MRIGHVMADVWAPGGVATYIRRVSAWQRAAGHEVVFFDTALATPSASADGPAVPAGDGAALAREARALGVDLLHAHIEVPGSLAEAGPLLRTVHGHQPYCPSGARYLAARGAVCRRPVSVAGCTWGHLVDRCGSAKPGRVLGDFRRTASARDSLRHHRALAVSQFVHGEMLRAGYDPAGVDVLLHAAPGVGAATAPSGPPRVLFVGRINPNKGLLWALEALAQTRTGVTLDVAGAGRGEPEARAAAERLGLAERVTFWGWLDEAAVAERMAAAWAVVVPSLWPEPAGLVTLEAHAHARAVVASRVGGIPEYTREGDAALLVEPGDVGGLAVALDRLAGDAGLAGRLGTTGRALVERHHTMAAHMAGLEAAYARCLAEA